ncbi:MAG: hypothetical protein A2939_02930 [Parcubacteria group bacterium RIFCSPLOWO2_01_FULL_48_18]|nr:MAG: hypothetical protein A2939_02930 [Parcubacteria group bacterium RIFCSPLOWO2_01_FULL_48_18]
MGIRCDQFMGLNKWALNFVKGEPVLVCTEEVTRVYPDGRRETLEPRPVHESSIKKEESGESYFGMFGDSYLLHEHTFPDGRVYFEKVQAEPWSSGPVFFLALQDENGDWVPESLWAEKVIKAI